MFQYIYEWIQNLAVYLILVTAVMQVIPGNNYKKYVQFFTGLVLILLFMTPIFKIMGIEDGFYKRYQNKQFEFWEEGIEKGYEMQFIEPENEIENESEIKVEGIRIGE
ncbi:MAG: stage III sporulation protein AF [Candidatus Ruminococcus intestinipullorum]|nr:stage III sporulation protein AF [Candidatus Ruminococcus intestinipullorum]